MMNKIMRMFFIVLSTIMAVLFAYAIGEVAVINYVRGDMINCVIFTIMAIFGGASFIGFGLYVSHIAKES